MKLSISLKPDNIINKKISVWENILGGFGQKGKLSLGEISSLVQRNIVDGIELVLSENISANDINKIKKILKKNNIPVLSVHQNISQITGIDLKSIITLFNISKKLSARIIVIHLSALGKNINNKSFISKLYRLQNQYGINIGLENSIKNIFLFVFNPISWDENRFAQTIRKTKFMITLDTTHMGYSLGNIINFYRNNRNRVINIHLSDFKGGILGMHQPIGKGILPINKFAQLLRHTHYEGIVTLEINCKNTDDIRSSIKYIQALKK